MLTAADTAYAIAHIRALEANIPAPERLFDDPTVATRRALLATAGVTPPPGVIPVGCDFRAERFEDDLVTALRARGLRPRGRRFDPSARRPC